MKIEASELQEPPTWTSRDELPQILNALGLLGVGVEVGVQRGVFASRIRQHWDGLLYRGVDPWRPYYGVRDDEQTHESYRRDAIAHLDATQKPYVLHRATALEFVEWAKNEGAVFSFVYLDGDHDEDPLRKEIESFWPLIAPGGILAGHDYQPNGWIRDEQPTIAYATAAEAGDGQHCGPFFVKRVVDESFPEELVSLTSEEADRGWRSWLVRKK